MKSLENLYKEVIADETEKKEYVDAVVNGKIGEFLTEHGCSATVNEARLFMEGIRHTELTDDELDNVSGGGCFGEDYDNRIKVSPTTHDCMYYACGICEEQAYYCKCRSMGEHNCGTCLHIRYDTDGVTYCNSVNVKQRGRPTYT